MTPAERQAVIDAATDWPDIPTPELVTTRPVELTAPELMPHSYPAEVKRSLLEEFESLTRRCLQHASLVELLAIQRDICKQKYGTLGLEIEEQLDAAILNLEGVKDGPIEVEPEEIEDRKYYVRMGRSR